MCWKLCDFPDHCHRNRDEEVDKKARRKLIIASILCVLFMILEVIGMEWLHDDIKSFF